MNNFNLILFQLIKFEKIRKSSTKKIMGKTREQVKLALKRFADKTAIHGLGNLSDASLSTRFRITTGIAFLVAFSACGYLIFKLLHALENFKILISFNFTP